MSGGKVQPDPLGELFGLLRCALAPLGIHVGAEVLALWRDAYEHRTGLFTGTGEFSPGVVRRLVEAVEQIKRSTADAPQAGKGDASGREA